MREDEDEAEELDFGRYPGKVVKNNDERGMHRIRAQIRGREQLTAWARPVTMGGGSARRGGNLVPPVGSDVLISYLHGSPDHPVYECAWWTSDEMPRDIKAAGANAHLVQAFEWAKMGGLSFRMTLDERPGSRAFRIYAVDEADEEVLAMLELDLEARGLRIYGLTGIDIVSDGFVWTTAPVIQLNERPVLPRSGSV